MFSLVSGKKINILILVLTALVIGFLFLNSFKYFNAVLESDSAIYATLGEKFLLGDYNKALHIWWQPLYPLTAALITPFTGDLEKSLFLVSVFSGALLLIPVFFIAYLLTQNKYFSILAAIISVFHTQLVKSFFLLLTENLYIFLLMSGTAVGLYTITKLSLRSAAITGAIFGITYYVRNDVLLPFQIYLLYLGMIFLFEYKSIKKVKDFLFITPERKIIFKVASLSVVLFLISISPYLYINSQKFGYLNLSAKFNAVKNMPGYFAPQNEGKSTFAQDVWSTESPNYDSHFFSQGFDYWRYRVQLWEDSVTRFKGYQKLILANETSTSGSLIILGLILAPLFVKNKRGLGYLYLFLLLGPTLSLPFQPGVDYRYIFWMYPLLMVFSTLALFSLTLLIKKLVNKSARFRVIGLLGILSLNILFINFFIQKYKDNLTLPAAFDSRTKNTSNPYKVVGSYIRSLNLNMPRIMTRREANTYYAKGDIIYIPTSIDTKGLEDYSRLWKVDYLIADKFTFAPETPLGYLVDESKAPDWLVPVKTWDGIMTHTILYKINL